MFNPIIITTEEMRRVKEGTFCSEVYRCLSLDLGSETVSQVTRLETHYSDSTFQMETQPHVELKGDTHGKTASQKRGEAA